MKGFNPSFKAFIKPFEIPQRSVKIKFKLIFFMRPGIGKDRVKAENLQKLRILSLIKILLVLI